MAHDKKRTAESKITTLSIRTVRNNRRTEQNFTNREFDRLIRKGL
jgi:hypothetical protein